MGVLCITWPSVNSSWPGGVDEQVRGSLRNIHEAHFFLACVFLKSNMNF